MLAKFIFIGDVHAEDIYLDTAIQFARKQGIETILCTGDIPDGKGDPNRCCALLSQPGIYTVNGNHDRWMLEGIVGGLMDSTPKSEFTNESVAFIESLPATIEFESPIGDVLLCHGLYENDMAKANFDDPTYILDGNWELRELIEKSPAKLILNGHSHHFQVGHYESRCFINAGTIYRDHDPQFHIVDLDRLTIQSYRLCEGDPIERFTGSLR